MIQMGAVEVVPSTNTVEARWSNWTMIRIQHVIVPHVVL